MLPAPKLNLLPHEEEIKRVKGEIKFPYSSLEEAINTAKKLYENCGTQPCLQEQFASMFNQSPSSGTYRNKINTARMYNLVEITSTTINLSRLGRDIVGDDDKLERQARVDAFLNVPLYNKLYEGHKGRVLPSDNGLEHEMETLGVPPKQKQRARQVFQRSAKQANFLDPNNRMVMPTSITSKRELSDDEKLSFSTKPASTELPSSILPAQPNNLTEAKYASQLPFGGGGGGGNGLEQNLLKEPFIIGLLQALPEPRTDWPKAKRDQWVTLASMVFNLLYTDGGEGN